MTYQRYQGSCHCQGVRYEARFDLAAGSNRCNCSLCSKARAWFPFVRASASASRRGGRASHYEWVPASKSEPFLDYAFCSRCGIRLYGTGDAPQMGGRFYAVNVPTLDDVDREALVAAPLRFVDGAHDRFDRAPEDTRLM